MLRRWRVLLVYTVVEIVGPWLLLGHAETRLTSSTTGLVIAAVPIVAAILLTVTGQDRLSRRRILGLVIGLVGVAVLLGLDVHADDLIAVGQVLLVVVGYAIGPIIISRQLSDLPSIGVVTASLILAAVIYAPFTPFVRPAPPHDRPRCSRWSCSRCSAPPSRSSSCSPSSPRRGRPG